MRRWLVFAELVVKLTNMRCENISVTDIELSWQMDDANGKLAFTVTVIGLKMTCRADYGTEYGVIRNGGNVVVDVLDNTGVETTITLTSPAGFVVEPPNSVVVESCDATIDVDKPDFDGDWTATVADMMSSMIEGVVEKEVSEGTFQMLWFVLRLCF